MALKLKYTDECGILHINMSPSASPRLQENRNPPENEPRTDIIDPKFDTINNRFGQYDLFGGKYDLEIGGETSRSLFRSRYNSVEEELANTPYAFATERTLRLNTANDPLHITIDSRASSDDASPSKDLLDDRFFNRNLNLEYDDGLFGPQIDFSTKSYVKTSDEEETPAFTVTQLIHAQDRYFDLSSRHSSSVVSDSPKTVFLKSDPTKTGKVKSLRNSFEVRSAPGSAKKERTVKIVERFGSVKSKAEREQAFKVLSSDTEKAAARVKPVSAAIPVVPTSKRKREQSFAILTETPLSSRPSSPRSLPPDIRTSRISPFKGRGFREETSRHTTPRTSAANSRASSPPRRRTNSLSRIEKMAQAATLPLPMPNLSRPQSPRNFLKENIQEVREISEFNRERHEAEEEKRKREEEEALLKEMGLLENNAKSEGNRSKGPSRTTSRSNSPSKIKIRSRSNSPSAVLQFENIPIDSKDFVTPDIEVTKPTTHKSRVRAVPKSKPQSNGISPKNSKIPRRQNSVSPSRVSRVPSHSRKPLENGLTQNQRFISNSTSSIHETIKIGSQVHDKRGLSKSSQYLDISPAHISGKPPISPGRGGPPPSNRSINSKRLSPIIGTPSKSPIEDQKPSSARTVAKPSSVPKKPVKTAGNTPATSRLNSRVPSRASSRDPSPEKRTNLSRAASNKTDQKSPQVRQVNRTSSTKTTQKPSISHIPEPKKIINRTNSMKSLIRTPSTKALNEKPPIVKKDSKKDLKALSTSKINEIGIKKPETIKNQKNDDKKDTSKKEAFKSKKEEPMQKKEDGKKKDSKAKDDTTNKDAMKAAGTTTEVEEVTTQDNETQYDTITNERGELILLTKKNIISMTTAAITAQPLEVVTTVTNQLPAALEKAREKGIFERLNSGDSLGPKENEKEEINEKETVDGNEGHDDKNTVKTTKTHTATIFAEDNIKMKPLQPPYNNPQVERAKQKIDDILKSPEVSSEKIFAPMTDTKQTKNSFKTLADKTKNDIKKSRNETTNKFTELKDLVIKQNDRVTADIRSEASRIVNSIITPVEEPKNLLEKAKEEDKSIIEPIVMVVNEKKRNGPIKTDIVEKVNEALVKGGPDIEVQSSNVSTPANTIRITVRNYTSDGDRSDKSSQSNGRFPQSTSTAPRPPPRNNRSQSPKGESYQAKDEKHSTSDVETVEKKPNICQRIIGKCKSKCCSCCVKPKDDEEKEKKGFRRLDEEKKKEETTDSTAIEEKKGLMNKLNCCKKNKDVEETVKDVEKTIEKKTKIEFENETKRKRKLRDVLCGCCSRRRRISDVSSLASRHVSDVASDVPATPSDVLTSPGDHVVQDAGCCGKKKAKNERRDSILSDRTTNTNTCCNNRVGNWLRGALHRRPEHSSSRRTSMFSKNKSLSPTLPPEDTRPKLDPTLVEHTSVMRGAVPVLPPALAYFCLVCNVIVPGLGTIFSGMFCLCFGIPRFGVHDGARQRMGSFFINLLVGCGQLFTVLFCLVGWGWSIWWGVIMVKIARRYRKMKAEAAAAEEEAAPPITDNNHTAA